MFSILLALATLGQPPVITATVAPSGRSIAVQSFAADGLTPSPITGFGGLDEAQSISVVGTPKGQSFTLSFDGASTGPIPFLRVPVSSSFAYNVALPSPGTYTVEVTAPTPRGTPPINYHAVFDGVVPLGQPIPVDLSVPGPVSPVDPVASTANQPASWRPLGSFTFATSSAVVEVSADLGRAIYVSAVRLTPAAGNAPIVQVMSDPANTAYGPDKVNSLAGAKALTDLPDYYGAGYFGSIENAAHGSVQPTFWYADPSAVQAEIDGLAGFGGACTAASPFFLAGATSGLPTPLAPQAIGLAFGGPKAGLAIGAPTPSDPAVAAAIVHPGGQPIRYRINGGTPTAIAPAGCSIAFGVAGGSPQSFFIAPTSRAIAPTDVVTLDAPGGAILTAAGPSAEVVGLVLGRYQVPAGPKPAMPVGWNGPLDGPFSPVPLYSNLARRILSTGQQANNLIAESIGDPGGQIALGLPGLPNDPAGVWTFTWDGASPPTLAVYDCPIPAIKVVAPGLGTASGIANPKLASPTLYVACPPGTTLTGVYPPGLYGGPLLHPDVARRLAIGPVRAIDWTGAASSNIAEYSDFAQPGQVGLYGNIPASAPLVSIAPDNSGYWDPVPGPAILVTTSQPHGLPELAVVNLKPGPGGWPAAAWSIAGIPYTNPYGLTFDEYCLVHVVSPTSFSFQMQSNPGYLAANAGVVLSAPLAPVGASLSWYRTPAIPWQDTVRFMVEIKALNPAMIPYLNEPGIASDDCSRRMAQEALKIPGKIRLEISNEPWNFGQSEWGRFRARTLAGKLGSSGDYVPGYLTYADYKMGVWESVFAAAGRSGDLIRVFGAAAFDASTTARYAAFAVANKIAIHEIGIAPYTRIEVPSAPNAVAIPSDLAGLFAGLTDDQVMDLALVGVETGPIAGCFASTRSAIDSAGLKRPDGTPVGIVAYEGGLDGVVPGVPAGQKLGTDEAFYSRHFGILRHPQMFTYSYREMGIAQAAGCSSWHEYDLADIPGYFAWSKVTSYGEPDGTGSPSDAPLSSQVAGAYARFAAPVAPPAPAPVIVPAVPAISLDGTPFKFSVGGSELQISISPSKP